MAANRWQITTSAFLVGVGVGTTLALLFAPKSGEEMREGIAGAVQETVDGAVAQGNKFGRRALKTYEETRETVKDIAEAAGQGYREAKTAAS